MLRTIELLSPAKNFTDGILAINCGADAIYIGPPKFGARLSAHNSISDIEKLIQYSHKFNCKVYATINTILYDNELQEAQNLIYLLYDIGIDAIIIQDFGLLELDLPPVHLHASTQTNNFDLEKIKFLEQIGFSRAILARELSIDEIKTIKTKTNIELETFIHGSLCVSMSGQCYLSQKIGNRSANRGDCAQPCRLEYNLIDKNNNVLVRDKHLLSLKDLNLTNHIESLIDAGVSSLKIEGRLKNTNYIKNVVSHYRKIIDEIISGSKSVSKSSSGVIFSNFEPDIEKTFNRGYTNYYFDKRDNDIANFYTPKSVGKVIGKVIECAQNYFIVDTNEKLKNGDGICYFENDILKGAYINRIDKNKIFLSSKFNGNVDSIIYRNFDIEFEKIIEQSSFSRKIRCNIEIINNKNHLVVLAIDENNNKIEKHLELGNNYVQNFELFKLNFVKQFQKTGNSIFQIDNINFQTTDLPFLTISEINSLRRDLLFEFENLLIMNYKKIDQPHKTKYSNLNNTELDYSSNILNNKAKQFYEKCGAKKISYAPEKSGFRGDEVLMTTKHCLKYSFGWCKKSPNFTNEINTDLYLENKFGKYKLEFDCQKCFMKILNL